MKFKGTSGKLRSIPFIWYLVVDTVTTGKATELMKERNFEKEAKSQFSSLLQSQTMVIPRAKNPPEGSILVLFVSWVRYWHMAKCFQRFVSVSRAVKWVRTKLGPKKSRLG